MATWGGIWQFYINALLYLMVSDEFHTLRVVVFSKYPKYCYKKFKGYVDAFSIFFLLAKKQGKALIKDVCGKKY